ncbi:cation diffusion facilitator family transporter [Pararoseomonas indoligenes]|uniref:Cation transporter n=1 Tax=Roseomonas indoligenes TaxID=2820811 RepID=A0A940S7L5_9PROT|nr:cation transporter [Pararoseomonas indoligenes]
MSSPSPLRPGTPDPAALRRERSILLACLLDWALILPFLAVGLSANSLTLVAEAIRGSLMVVLEMVLLVVLRRIHRGRITEYDYGAAKIEEFANLAIGVAMGAAGVWITISAASRWLFPPEQEGLGLVLATALSLANVVMNGIALRALWSAGRDGTSAIMTVQIRSRTVKLASSGIVAVAIAVNAAAQVIGGAPPWLAPLAEAIGTGFVGLVMIQLAISLWRESVPQLLDRSLDESRQASINRALAGHFADYDALLEVKSRIAGKQAVVEIALGFERERRIGEIQRVADAVVADLRALIPGAVVTVTPVALPA